ncbi:Gldg family protein [Akkermansiaceae bacterium]|nr:Gldg family protein [Akkermansiaceae bacterium]
MNVSKAFAIGITTIGFILFVLSQFLDSLSPHAWYLAIGSFIALSFVPNSRLIRVGFAAVALPIFIFFFTEFVSRTDVGNKSIDLTEDNRYTLNEGTRAILTELKDPVTINYYVTRDVDGTPSAYKRHIPRVDSFLRQVEGLANDKNITLNFIDPEPNTDEEDAALLDQVQQIPVTQDDKFLFGASISSLDKKTVIPFFAPSQETQLEFQLISAIAEVSRRETPVVGLISAHNLASGGQTNRGWLFYQLLQRSYDVANLGMMPIEALGTEYERRKWGDAPDYLDPEKIKVLLVIHPAGITPQTEFILDQYILRGGTVIACVDPLSLVAQQSGRPQIPGMPPQGGTPPSSSLPKLFKKHNIGFKESQVVIDRIYAPSNNPRILLLNEESMTAKDDISLSEIKNLAFLMSGGFTGENGKPMGPGLEVRKLVESSYKYTFVTDQTLNSPDAANQLRFALGSRREGNEKQTYVALLSGTFTTAFPEGDPSAKEGSDENETEEDEKEKTTAEAEALTTGIKAGNLYLFSDSDFLYDGMAYNARRMFNTQVVEPITNNGAFMFNILDQAVGSEHLVGARARAEVYRPFTVLKELEAESERKSKENLDKLQAKEERIEKEFQQIRSQMSSAQEAQMSPELQAKRDEYIKNKVQIQKDRREEKKAHQGRVDLLKANIFWSNILYMPLGVIVIGLFVFVWRKQQTKAR